MASAQDLRPVRARLQTLFLSTSLLRGSWENGLGMQFFSVDGRRNKFQVRFIRLPNTFLVFGFRKMQGKWKLDLVLEQGSRSRKIESRVVGSPIVLFLITENAFRIASAMRGSRW